MAADVAEKCVDLCRQEAEGELLVVPIYDDDDIRHVYMADEVEAHSDKVELDSLHRPVQSIHRTLDFVSQLNKIGGSHEGSMHFYEYVTYLHVPIGEQSGVIISLDPRSDRHDKIYNQCLVLVTDGN